jgi:hypothetical protein
MKLGLFSVSYAGLWGQHVADLLAVIAKAAALGFDTVRPMGKRPHLSRKLLWRQRRNCRRMRELGRFVSARA